MVKERCVCVCVCVSVCVCGISHPPSLHTQTHTHHYMLTAGSPKHRMTGYTFTFHFTFQAFKQRIHAV